MNKTFICSCAFLMIVSTLCAQEKIADSTRTQVLEEVVVSDTRFPTKRENSGKTVIKIGPEELKRNQGKSVAQIINTKSGIEISGSRGRQGEVLGAFIRGGRGKQVLVLIDGVRVSNPSSFSQEYDLRLLPAAAIASIEIIKGASSALYGANAASAVINITTREASTRPIQGNFQSSMGTNQTEDDQNFRLNDFTNSVWVDGTLEKFSYKIGFNNRFSDGMSSLITPENEKDPFSSFNTDLRLGYRINNNFRMNLYGNQSNFRSAYDESFGLTDAPYTFESEQKRVGITSIFTYGKGITTLNAAYTTYNSENISAFPGEFDGSNFIADLFNKYTFKNLNTIIGINYNREWTEFETLNQFTFADPYVSMVYASPLGINLNIGGRLNMHSEYGSEFVYNLNPSFTVKREVSYFKIFGTYATAYITPSLTQLFGQFGANPLLKPEANRTLEGGLEYAVARKLRANVVYFNRKEEDYVFFDNGTFTYNNADTTIDAQGMEFEIEWSPVQGLNFQSNYTFTERKGDNAIRIPKHKLNTTIGYQISKKQYASVSYSYMGERLDTDFNAFEDLPLESFSLLGCYMSHEILPDKLDVFLNVENLLNTDYTEVIGFTTRGRNIRVGFNLNL